MLAFRLDGVSLTTPFRVAGHPALSSWAPCASDFVFCAFGCGGARWPRCGVVQGLRTALASQDHWCMYRL